MINRTFAGLTSCGVLVSLSVFSLALALNEPSPGDNMKPFSLTDQTGFKETRFRGEVVRIDGKDYLIKTKDGEEVRLHTDRTTRTVGQIKEGDRIQADVDEKNNVSSMELFSYSDLEQIGSKEQK